VKGGGEVGGGPEAQSQYSCHDVAMAGDETLSQGEHFVLRLHPHWKTLLRPFFILLVILVAAIAALIMLPAGSSAGIARDGIGIVVFLALIIWGVVPVLRWRTTTYELTTRRLRLREGILSRTGRDFPLIRISDVSFTHGPIDRLLGCGKLIVESAGEHGQLVLNEIPQVQQVQSTLFQLVADEQARLAREDR
jgi:uncharacterized membrane protein YdbT with pleckstrin-like domain